MARRFMSGELIQAATFSSALTTEFTMGGWFMMESVPSLNNFLFTYNGDAAAASRGWGILYLAASTAVQLIYGGVTNGLGFVPTVNVWFHSVIRRTGATSTHYKDAVSQGTTASAPNAASGTDVMEVGSTGTHAIFHAADVFVYNRALSLAEITAIFAGDSPQNYSNLRTYYPMRPLTRSMLVVPSYVSRVPLLNQVELDYGTQQNHTTKVVTAVRPSEDPPRVLRPLYKRQQQRLTFANLHPYNITASQIQ